MVRNLLELFAIFFAILSICLLIRLPLLYNLDLFLTADEAVMASQIAELLNGGKFFFFYENIPYHGVLNGLISLPFMAVFGINTLGFMLPGVLYYALYVFTGYLVVREINKEAAYIFIILLLIPSNAVLFLTIRNFPHVLIAVFGNLIFLAFIKTYANPDNKNIFLFSALTGFSIYVYIYSIVFILPVIFLLILSHPDWHTWRGTLFSRELIFPAGSAKKKIARAIDFVLFFAVLMIIWAYVSSGLKIQFGDYKLLEVFIFQHMPHFGVMGSNNLYTPFTEILLLGVLRLLFYREDIRRGLLHLKTLPKTKPALAVSGFLLGISPKLLYAESPKIFWNLGLDTDIRPTTVLIRLVEIFKDIIPTLLGVNFYFEYFFYNIGVVLVSFLVIVSTLFFIYNYRTDLKSLFTLKPVQFSPDIFFLVLPISVITAVVVYQHPNSFRHMFPLLGVAVFWVAVFLKEIRIKSVVLFAMLIGIWIFHYSQSALIFYNQNRLISGISINEQKVPIHEIIHYLRKQKIQVVYGNYLLTHKADFLAKGNPRFHEYYATPLRGGTKKRASEAIQDFAIAVPLGQASQVYNQHINEQGITCTSKRFKKLIIYSACSGETESVNRLRSLIDITHMHQIPISTLQASK